MGCAASHKENWESKRRRKASKELMKKLNRSRLVYVTKALEGKSELGIEAGQDNKFLKAPSVIEGVNHMAVLPEEKSLSGDRSELDELDSYHMAVASRMSLITLGDTRAKVVDPAEYIYDFENLVFEGGGMKGIGYCGAIRYLEELEIMHQIKNFAGTSVGALVAVLLAMGCSSKDMECYLKEDIKATFYDASCGVLSIIPNLLCLHGWHTGTGIYEWLGRKLDEKMGSPDATFMEMYHYLHKGVCIVVTNLTHMTTEYCHAKTTPDMPIRLAVRMSMAIPGLFQPVKYTIQGRTNVYVDGGLLCNYPIHSYDGWYLSMKPEDSFLHRLQPLRDLPIHLERNNRFNPPNDRTIGFLLFSESEEDVLRYRLQLRDGKIEPMHPRTQTSLYKKHRKAALLKERANREYAKTLKAVDAFLKARYCLH
ncbi:hypothetical protein C0Q70_09536 [Pomacea canaliculata]|uniref:PNPLA domain-containing protein n=1 Tax=Pomacea canaliculata TaxID=400727 RepID=A0A2T7PA30_POMCA|nr:hypothetical protein C0Q70_09536 [Pomacea canaliculata]